MNYEKKSEIFDFVGAFEQAWVQFTANAIKLIPYGLASTIPPLFSYFSITLGAIAIILLEGYFLLLMADAVNAVSNLEEPNLLERLKNFSKQYFVQGLVLSVFMIPLIVFGFVALVLPSIIIFSFFIFSFFQITRKEKFAIDACMESLRMGSGYRLHIFLLSLIIYLSLIVAYILCSIFPYIFIFVAGIILPYFFLVIQEFFEQLEIK